MKKKKQQKDNYIVAVGASAGGLEAIHAFFDNMPENSHLSFVVIQHLSSDFKSLLVELLSKHTYMKVEEAAHDMLIERDCVYVIPNNKMMTVTDGRLQLIQKATEKVPNTAVDIFLHSLAKDQGPLAIAVILSGTGTDGTKGAQAVKEAGGIVFVQDPVTARFNGMPNSVIGSGFVDYVLPPEQMPEEIHNYISDMPAYLFSSGKIGDDLLKDVYSLVYKHCGHDFQFYKPPTLIRRIVRRMTLGKIKDLKEYVDFLHMNPGECKALYKDFLIHVTRFFRDQPAFEALYNEVFPGIFSAKQDHEMVKVWVTACSTGEEAYSIAILLDKYVTANKRSTEIKIFATDIDVDAVETASRGIYSEESMKEVDPEILANYFTKDGSKYTVIPRIRKQIVFARHNILRDPPFIRNDLVTCRNMLIYMGSVLQRKVLSSLYFGLLTDGYLFLGPSESVDGVRDGLEDVNAKWKIYRKNGTVKPFQPEGAFATPQLAPVRHAKTPVATLPGIPGARSTHDILEDFKEALMEDAGFAGLYIDKNYEIREAVGNFNQYLALPDKRLQLNLLKMVLPDLSVALNTTIRKAWKEQKKISLPQVKIRKGDTDQYISILVNPNKNASNGNNYTFILLGEGRQEVSSQEMTIDFSDMGHSESSRHIVSLETELNETKESLKTVLESYEAANEELQSSNEELLSANEELQSSNEELQSLNEELHTLNTEHQLKIRELVELNDDLNNYFLSTNIGQVFLDADMNIRKFNPAAVNLINLIESDIGRPISHISTNIKDDKLVQDIQHVLRTSKILEKEIVLQNGGVTLVRVLPYIRQDKRTDGVVITFVDITTIKQLDSIVKGIFNASQSAIMAFHAVRGQDGLISDLKLIAANDASSVVLRKNKSTLVDQGMQQAFTHLANDGLFAQYVNVIKTGQVLHTEQAIAHGTETTWYDIVAVRMHDGLVATFTDINEKKENEERLRRNYNELIVARENLKTLNSVLEDKVHERTIALSTSEERFRMVAKAANDTIWDWSLANNTIWWSDNIHKQYGHHQENNVFSASFRIEHIHPDDQQRVRDSLSKIINNNNTSEQWVQEYRFRRDDGTYALILDRGYLLRDEHGTPYRMLGSMMDVTNLRRAEEEAQSIGEEKRFLAASMPLIVWTANPNGSVSYINPQFADFTGIQIKEGSPLEWRLFVHPDDVEDLELNWDYAVVHKEDFAKELRLKDKNGDYYWYLLRAKAKKEAHGEVVFWVCTNTDINAQKQVNEILELRVQERTKALKISNEQLEQSNMELQHYAYVASHDLKEPLRKISMFSNMLKDKLLSNHEEKAHDYMDRIIRSATRMMLLIDDLLSFSKISSYDYYEPTDLKRLVQDILSDLELAIVEKQAVIELSALPKIEAIPGQLRQVFQNLISNALKFVQENKTPVIHIESMLVAEKSFDSDPVENGPYCLITVRDNGIGFNEKYIEKIFTIFQRLHTRDYDGTGIGLAVARKIISKHNGLITAKSQEGEGAQFMLLLPVKQVETEAKDNLQELEFQKTTRG